jgi:hypothetical protein
MKIPCEAKEEPELRVDEKVSIFGEYSREFSEESGKW